MACETQDAAFAGIHAEFVRQQAEIARLRAALEVALLALQEPHHAMEMAHAVDVAEAALKG
jgi:hypothetical protein